MTSRRALWFLIVVSAGLRLAWAAALDLGNDEAYHYLFAARHDWSYFDHPPMLAVVERLGIVLTGGGTSPFSLRLGFIALFAGSTWLLARLTERFYGARAGFLAALALNVTAYHSAAAGTFVLPDGPLLFFWLLTLERLAAAFDAGERLAPWFWMGAAWGGAMLSKYHAVFIPLGTFLYFVLEPSARHWFRRPGPYLAALTGLALFSPVIWWNATHGWASFAFQGGRAVGDWQFHPEALAGAVVGQACYMFPWIWGALVLVLIRHARGFRTQAGPHERFLLCLSVVPLTVFLAVACTRAVLPHWTLVGFLSLFPLLGRAWADEPVRSARRVVVLPAVLLLACSLVLVQARTGFLQQGGKNTLGLLKVSRDPTVDGYGWDQVAAELQRRGLLDQPDTFLFTSIWFQSGHVAYATRAHAIPVACYSAGDARSFGFWSRPADWLGKDGVLLSVNGRSAEPHCYDDYFERIEPLGEFEVERAGTPVRKIRLFRCIRQTVPFPFNEPRRRRAERASAAAASPVLNSAPAP